jgi:hypothetical protein
MKNECDLQSVVPSRESLRRILNEREIYEVRFEALSQRAAGGKVSRMHVFRSVDGGKTWLQIPFKRMWRQWWAILNGGLGGSLWPPAGEDVRDAYFKDGRFSICYGNLFEHGPDGQAYFWEIQYCPDRNQWEIGKSKEVT